MAFFCTAARSFTDPRSPVQVTTSKPYVSRSQATATDVSRPPLYASTQVSPWRAFEGFKSAALVSRDPERGEAREQRTCMALGGRRDEHRVVAGHRTDDVRQLRG